MVQVLSIPGQGDGKRRAPANRGEHASLDLSNFIDTLVHMSTTDLDITQAARWFHALSDETRLGVVRLLSGGERCVCELQEAMGAAQSRLSFHLRVLREAGLVTDRKEGRWTYYSLSPEALDALAVLVAELKPREHDWGCRGGCCR